MTIFQRTLASLTAALLVTNSPSTMAEDLLQIYQAALQSDPVLSAQQSAFDAASASQREVRSIYLPSLSFNASLTQSKNEVTAPTSSTATSGDFDADITAYDITLLQPIYRKDYLSQLKQAEASTRQAEAELNQAYQDVILRVAQRYFDVLAARDEVEFSIAEKSAISRQLDQAKQRFDVGLIAITDVHEAQAAYDLASASEIVARNSLANSREALRELTGELPQKLLGLGQTMPLAPPEPSDINAWLNSALDNNFTLIAAEAATEAARQAMEQQRGNRHPALELFATYGVDDYSDSPAEREETNSSIGLQLSIPLYQGGGISAGIKRTNALYTQARDFQEQQRRTIQRETSDAYLGVLAGIGRVKALRQAVISSQSALDATEAGYDVGTRTTVDVLNARSALFAAQRDFASSRYDYVLASMRLKQASGALDIKDIERINAWLETAP